MSKKKFDFIKEVVNRNINVDLLRYGQACVLVNAIKEMDQEQAEDFVYNGGCSYIDYDDEHFLTEVSELFNEKILKEIIDEIEVIQYNESLNKVLITDNKKFNIKSENIGNNELLIN